MTSAGRTTLELHQGQSPSPLMPPHHGTLDGQAIPGPEIGLRFEASAEPTRHALVRAPQCHEVSDSEVAQFVIFALERALAAIGEEDPETSLRLSACEARRGMRTLFASIAARRRADAELQHDYREAVLFQNLTLDLALEIVGAVRRYGKARESAA